MVMTSSGHGLGSFASPAPLRGVLGDDTSVTGTSSSGVSAPKLVTLGARVAKTDALARCGMVRGQTLGSRLAMDGGWRTSHWSAVVAVRDRSALAGTTCTMR